MKKTLILLTMISSVATFSKTNGFVEAYNENEANFKKNTDATFTAKELGVKTQVNIERSNLSFGGDFKFKDLQLNNTTPKNFLNHSSVWIKYDLSKKETGINSYVKATIKPKFHAEEAGKEMEQVKEEIQKLEKDRVQLTQAKEKADKDVREMIKNEALVQSLENKENNFRVKIQEKENEKKTKEEEKRSNNAVILDTNQKKTDIIKKINNSEKEIEEINKKIAKIEKEIENANEQEKNTKQQEIKKLKKERDEDEKNEKGNILKAGKKPELERQKESEKLILKVSEECNGKKIIIENELNNINKAISDLEEEKEQNLVLLEKAKHKKNSTDAQKLNKAVADAQAALEANKASITEKTAAKNEIEVYKDNGGIDLEGDLSYKTEGAVFGVNSVLNVPFSNTYIKGNSEITKDFATLIKSTHTAYFGVSDVLSGGLSVQHSYKGEDAMKYVSAKLDGKYAVSNDLDLVGKFRFKYQFNGDIDFKNEYLGNKDLLSFVNPKWNVSPLTYIHMYSLGLNYRNTLNITGFVGHGYEKTKDVNYLNYGVMADVKYTGIDKLTLKANATLSELKVGDNHIGLFEFGANAKYDFNATDKFTVSPELDANVKFKTKEKAEDVKFVVTPKVSVKYVPVNGLTLSGSVGVPVTVMNSAYESTSIKTNLNIRYEW